MMIESQARELGDEPAAVAVDCQTGKTVSLAKDEPIGGFILSQAEPENLAPQPDRAGQGTRPESLIERPVVPPVKSNPDRARGVV